MTTKPDDKLASLRRLLNTSVSLDRAYAELNRRDDAAPSTVEALMWSLRERGTAALAEPDTLRRLSQLSDVQVMEVGKRLRELQRHIGRGPWSDDEIKKLFRVWR